MANISDENKNLARKVASVFGGSPKVNRYFDESEESFVDLVDCVDQPSKGVTSYGTIGLSDHPLIQNGEEFPVRLELVGVLESENSDFPNILTTAAFYIINKKWFCYPGAVLQNVIDMYDNSLQMKHLMFISPFLWDQLKTTKFDSKDVTWLLAIPISEGERGYAEKHGSEALEDLFEEHQIDVFNLSRKSLL